jgi:uncharacterized repeat protein (TIGR01451 family)
VLYTLDLSHTAQSGADAFDVVVTDTVPPGLTYVPGSAVPPAVVTGGRTLTWRVPALTQAEGRTTFTYRARVDLTAPVDVPVTNTAEARWTTLGGPNPNERTGVDGAGGLNDLVTTGAATVTPSTDAFLDAIKTVSDLNGGEVFDADVLEYAVLLRNEGALPVSNVVFTDPVPVGTTYVAGSLMTSRGTPDESNPRLLRVDVGPMLVGDTVTITFRVTVDGPAVAGKIMANQGSVDSDQTPPEPTDADGIDANGDQPTVVIVGEPVGGGRATLTGQKLVELLVDEDMSGDVTAGDRLRYTVLLTASGQTLTNVTLSDMIPVGLTAVPGSETVVGGVGGSVTIIGSSVDALIAQLSPGPPAAVTFEVTIDSPLVNLDGDPDTETFTNQGMLGVNGVPAGVTDADGDPTNGNQPTQIMAVAVPGTGMPLLDVQKGVQLVGDADADGLVDPRDTVEWRVTLRNVGSATAQTVVVEDQLPPNTTLVGPVVTSQGVVFSTEPIGVNVGSVPPGRRVIVTFRTTVNAGTPDQTVIPNQAVASGGNVPGTPSDNDGDPTNGRGPTTVLVVTDADLSITKSAAPSPAAVDGTLIYTLVVANDGLDSAPNTVVTDTLPASVVLLSAVPSQGVCSGTATVTCALGDLAAGGAATVTVTVRPTAEGTLDNVATVTSDRRDPDPSDNRAAISTPVEALADLAITKSVAPDVVRLDEEITFTVVVSNAGPSLATDVVVTDALPAGVAFVSATADAGSCADAGGTVTCTIPRLTAGAAATITIVTTRTSPDPIKNTATVDGKERDPDEENNTATASLTSSVPEDCGNCLDDDGDGLVDIADPDCCAAQPLTVTHASLTTPKAGKGGMLRMKGTFPDDTFAGMDPRQQDVRLQVANPNGTLVCCTIPGEKWMKLYKRTFGFWDQKMKLCPPIKDFTLALPTKGTDHLKIVASGMASSTVVGTPLDVTVGMGGQCTAGTMTLRRKSATRAVFP